MKWSVGANEDKTLVDWLVEWVGKVPFKYNKGLLPKVDGKTSHKDRDTKGSGGFKAVSSARQKSKEKCQRMTHAKGVSSVYKEELFYDKDGQKVMHRTKLLKDRFDDEKGYFMYCNGHTINGMAGVYFPETLTRNDVANLAYLSRHLVADANFLGYRSNGTIKPMIR